MLCSLRRLAPLNADSHLEYCNKEVRSRAHRKDDEQVLAIKTNIAALPRGQSEEHCQLRLLDTPGTNEANEDRLRYLQSSDSAILNKFSGTPLNKPKLLCADCISVPWTSFEGSFHLFLTRCALALVFPKRQPGQTSLVQDLCKPVCLWLKDINGTALLQAQGGEAA